MELSILGKRILSLILVMNFTLYGCLPSDIPSSKREDASAATNDPDPGSTSGSSNNGETNLGPKVELRHLIEPNFSTDPNYSSGTGYAGGGSYVRKLTLPKNYAGKLYVAGINIGTLSDRHVKVRFKFGVSRDAITVPATVTQAPGITPLTTISVLVIDMRSEPFRKVRLPYDLYDYNEYDMAAGDTPVQDNRNSELYCRGLRLEDDSTFVGVGECDGLQPDEECLYTYAKVLDQGLVKISGTSLVPLTPDLPQVKSISGSYYKQDYVAQALRKALPDTVALPFTFSENPIIPGATDSVLTQFLSDWTSKPLGASSYFYRGPYRLINSSQWHFKFSDLSGPKRLFVDNSEVVYNPYVYGALPDDPIQAPPYSQYFIYYNSYMFPRAVQLDLPAGVAHLSSSQWDQPRSEAVLGTAGKTLWMDGSNARAQSRNSDLEHIGSCNVTSMMEVIAKDANGNEYKIAEANDVKLQLVRPIQHYTDTGNDVLYSNYKTCTSNSVCGSSECCFNNRCWDQTLVSQCFDSTGTQGNKEVGDSCLNDLDCSSLCCNRTSGLCAPHNSLISPAVLCSKPIGDYCIAKEWCQKSPVVKCLVIKTGTDPLGNVTCRQHCYTNLEFGDCKNGICIPPVQDPIPVFDPNAPGACDAAVPAPNF